MTDELRDLRLSKKLPAGDMVAVIQKLYPSFDKTMLSKSEHGNKYGVALRRDALDALIETFAPETRQAVAHQRNGRHRLTCSISCRLKDDTRAALQQHIQADGYKTVQDWLADVVRQYLIGKEMEEQNGNNN